MPVFKDPSAYVPIIKFKGKIKIFQQKFYTCLFFFLCIIFFYLPRFLYGSNIPREKNPLKIFRFGFESKIFIFLSTQSLGILSYNNNILST